MSVAMSETQPRLLIPGLRGFYDWAGPVSWLLVRVTIGWMLLPNAWAKWSHGVEWTAANIMAKRVPSLPSEPTALFIMVLEVAAALCIPLGLFTRFFAAALAIQMAVIYAVMTGPSQSLAMMWGLIALAVALRGGGPYSLDRLIGREL